MLLTALCHAVFSVRMPGIVPGCCGAVVWGEARAAPLQAMTGTSSHGRAPCWAPGEERTKRCLATKIDIESLSLPSPQAFFFLFFSLSPLCLLGWGASERPDGRFGQGQPNLEKMQSSSVQIQKYTRHGGKLLKQMNNVWKRTNMWEVQSMKGVYYTFEKNDI